VQLTEGSQGVRRKIVDIVILILLVGAAIMFGLAALRVGSAKVELVALGLLLWVLVPLLLQIDGLR
jgi:hypothetical protein